VRAKTQTLSVCVVTNATEARLRSALTAMRDYADEIVVTLDSSTRDDAVDAARALSDSVAIADLDGLAENARGWTAERARGDWILALDDDELMAPGFAARLPELLSSRWSHFHLPVRWVVPGPDGALRWLRQFPWHPNQATRLFRNVSGTFRQPARLHSVWEVAGDGSSLYDDDVAIYHLNLAMYSREEREEKMARRYRPMAAGGLPTCEEYYLFEDYDHTIEYGEVPAEVAAALSDDEQPLPAQRFPPPVDPAGAVELASYRAAHEPEPPIWSAEYLEHTTPDRWFTNRGCTVELAVRNTSAATWGTSGEVVGRVVLSYRWRRPDGELVIPQGDISLLPHPCAPGEELRLIAGLWTPPEPGRYVLEWDMLCERVSWFSDRGVAPLRVPVEITELGPRPPAPHFPGQERAPDPAPRRAPAALQAVSRWLAR
jgi:hypothetical protein